MGVHQSKYPPHDGYSSGQYEDASRDYGAPGMVPAAASYYGWGSSSALGAPLEYSQYGSSAPYASQPYGAPAPWPPTLPPAPWSPHGQLATTPPPRLPGNKKALLIGINYTGQRSQLPGCQNDVQKMTELLRAVGWQEHEMLVLTDSPLSPTQPTRDNILQAFRWLSLGTMPGDIRFLHFSGHGGVVPPEPGTLRSPNSFDQTMIPVDHMNGKRQIRGQVIYQEVVAPLPSGSRLTVIMDCCHSGAVLDLPYQFVAHQFEMTKYFQNGRRIPGTPSPFRAELDRHHPISSGLKLMPQLLAGRMESVLDGPTGGGPEGWRYVGGLQPAADVLMLSSCKDWQLSADIRARPSYDPPDGSRMTGGALTYAVVRVLNEVLQTGRQITILELLDRVREMFKQRNLLQVPQVSSSALLDLDAPFSIHSALTPAQQGPVLYNPW
eukprot:EG_transcript_9951